MVAPTFDADTVRHLVAVAVTAPSIHNTQPWRFRVGPDRGTIEVHAAEERRLEHADPDARALHLSVGAALFNLRCAVARTGRRASVRLRPDTERPGLLATVAPGEPVAPEDPLAGRLYDAIPHRHSSRRPYSSRRPPDALLRALCEAAETEGALLHMPDEDDSVRLRHLVATAEARDHEDRGRREESRAWIREAAGDGLPPNALGPQDAKDRLPVRDFSSLQPRRHQPPEPFEAVPCLAVLLTRQDTPGDWLAAGQALERVLLSTTAEGLVASMLHQPLEWHDLRWEVRSPGLAPGFPQMVLRLGYGPQGPTTPRLPVDAVLDIAG